MVPYAELDTFFSELVATAQSRGITCAITSGMACVHFGVAAQRRRLRKIMRDFHIRAFGEDMARINFLPEKRRKAAVAAMIDHARSRGVDLGRPALGVTP